MLFDIAIVGDPYEDVMAVAGWRMWVEMQSDCLVVPGSEMSTFGIMLERNAT